jgi:hypothetical protein
VSCICVDWELSGPDEGWLLWTVFSSGEDHGEKKERGSLSGGMSSESEPAGVMSAKVGECGATGFVWKVGRKRFFCSGDRRSGREAICRF